MFKQLVIIAFLLRFSYSVALENCPLSEKEWRSRGKKMNCKLGLSYHCLMDYSGNSTEFCLTRKEYDKRGCPWVLKRGERYFLGEPFTSCINNMNNTYCPIEGTTYYSDELYKYPACLVKEEKRQDFTLPESIDDSIIDSSNQNESYKENNTVTVVIVVFAVVVVVAAIASSAVHCIWKRKRAGKKADKRSPNKELENKRYTWDIEKIIKSINKEDNPEKVGELYSSLKGMDEKHYKEYVTGCGITEGSLVRYALKMNRRKTVLSLLNRKNDLFEEDKKQDILNQANNKGWITIQEIDEGISADPEKDIRMHLL